MTKPLLVRYCELTITITKPLLVRYCELTITITKTSFSKVL